MTSYKVQKYRCRLVKDGVQSVARKTLPNDSAAAEVFRAVLRGLPHEEVWVALMNAANGVMGLIRVSQGGAHASALKPSDVLRPVIVSGASGFVMAHNHPSGDPTPSEDDLTMTRQLLEASAVVGVTFLDHLVMVDRASFGREWRSIRDSIVFE